MSKVHNFKQDEPVMVVSGGWGIHPDLEGTIIQVNAAQDIVLEDNSSYRLSFAKQYAARSGWSHEPGDTFASCSIRLLTPKELQEWRKSQGILENPVDIRDKILELEARMVEDKRMAKELRQTLADMGFSLI